MKEKAFKDLDLEDLAYASGGCHGQGNLVVGQNGGQLTMGENPLGGLGIGSPPPGGFAIEGPINEGGFLGIGQGPIPGGSLSVGQGPIVTPSGGNLSIAPSPMTWSITDALMRAGNDAPSGFSPQMFFRGPHARIA